MNRLERERLRWQCRRGMLELDLLLEAFLQSGYDELPQVEKGLFEGLLQQPDQVLFEQLMGLAKAEEKEFFCVIEKIRSAVKAHY